MSLGDVKVHDSCIEKWNELRRGQIKACNFKINDKLNEILVDEGSEIPKNTLKAWKQWVSSLPEDECRFA